MSELARRLKAVDPNLTIISGHRRKEKVGTHLDDWERAAGVICSHCTNDTLQLINDLCPKCHHEKEAMRMERVEESTMRHYYKKEIRQGTISLARMREGYL